jgi:hypothetical protein
VEWGPEDDISSEEELLLAAGGYEHRLAEHPALSASMQLVLLEVALAQHPQDPGLLVRLAGNPGALEEVLEAAWEASADEAPGDEWASVRAALAGNPATTPGRLEELLEECPEALAGNGALPAHLLDALLGSSDPSVRRVLAGRADLPVSAQLEMARSSTTELELSVNPGLSEEARAVLATRAGARTLQVMAARGQLRDEELVRLVGSGEPAKRAVAAAAGPAEVASVLVRDKALAVKWALCTNWRCPDEVLTELSGDPGMLPVLASREEVPDAVGEALLEGSRNVLRTLARSGSSYSLRALEALGDDAQVWRAVAPEDFDAKGWMPGWWAVRACGVEELARACGVELEDLVVLSEGFAGTLTELLEVASALR